MALFKRLKAVLSANANAFIDNLENPEAMIDQYVRDLDNQVSVVRKNTASVLATSSGIERKIDVCKEEISEFNNYATKAAKAGCDDDARRFIEERIHKENELEALERDLTITRANAVEMKNILDSLTSDLDALKSKRDILKSKITVSETQTKINTCVNSYSKSGSILDSFNAVEERINKQIDEATALESLCNRKLTSSINDLKQKYSSADFNENVEKALLEIKAS